MKGSAVTTGQPKLPESNGLQNKGAAAPFFIACVMPLHYAGFSYSNFAPQVLTP
jgi:hypothetical protein